MTNVNIALDKELHRKARIICAMRGISLSDFYTQIISKRVKDDIRFLEAIQ